MSSKSKTTSSLLSNTAEATSHNIITSSITLSEVMSSTSMSSTFDGMNSITSYYVRNNNRDIVFYKSYRIFGLKQL